MPTDPDRQARHDEIRERFLADPEFRAAVQSDPTGTLEAELGELTDEERTALSDLAAEPGSGEDIVAHIRSRGVGAW